MHALLILGSSLIGCDHQDSDTAAVDVDVDVEVGCFANPPSMVIGSDDGDWQALADGDPVTMVHGPQGGWHILGSFQAENVDQIVTIEFTIAVKASGDVISDNNYRVALVDTGECSWYFPGLYGYLSVDEISTAEGDTPPELLSHKTVVMAMTVTDTEGRTTSSSVDVTAMPDPIDLPESDSGSSD